MRRAVHVHGCCVLLIFTPTNRLAVDEYVYTIRLLPNRPVRLGLGLSATTYSINIDISINTTHSRILYINGYSSASADALEDDELEEEPASSSLAAASSANLTSGRDAGKH